MKRLFEVVNRLVEALKYHRRLPVDIKTKSPTVWLNPYGEDELIKELSRDEGRERFLYKDTEGILTIGVGHNIEVHGLPEPIIDALLIYDIETFAIPALDKLFPKWKQLPSCRQRALLNMAFNLGYGRLKGFKKMWEAIEIGDWQEAGVQAKDSKWYSQVGSGRADRIIKQLVEG